MNVRQMYPTDRDIARRQSEGLIVISKLVVGTILYIDTISQVYAFQIISGGRAIGKANGHEPFIVDMPCTLVGCINEHGKLYSDKIVYGLHLIIAIPKGRTVTGRVFGASLHGPDWKYELWRV